MRFDALWETIKTLAILTYFGVNTLILGVLLSIMQNVYVIPGYFAVMLAIPVLIKHEQIMRTIRFALKGKDGWFESAEKEHNKTRRVQDCR